MARIELSTLEIGLPLAEPLYDKGGSQLLLEREIVITSKLLELLAQRGIRYGYSGKKKRSAVSTPLSEMADVAEKNAVSLQREVEQELRDLDLDPEKGVNPILQGVDDEFQATRSEERLDEWRNVRHQGATLIQDIVQGGVEPESVAGSANEIAESLLDNVCTDNPLVSLLAHVKHDTAYLYDHSVNRAIFAAFISIAMGYDRNQVKVVVIASLLADIGMPMIPREVVNAQRSLTASEFVDIQKHSVYGVHAVTAMRGLPYMARFITYQLHERIDGTGYPKGRTGNLVCKFAKIVAVADVYHALISDRPWRPAYHPYRAVEIIIREAKTKYDPEAVRGLLHFLSLYPIGTIVQLSSGEIGKVVHANGRFIDKPIVTIFIDKDGTRRDKVVPVDLSSEEFLSVSKVIEDDMGIALNLGFIDAATL